MANKLFEPDSSAMRGAGVDDVVPARPRGQTDPPLTCAVGGAMSEE